MNVRPAKTRISLGIRPVWSESSLGTQWVAKDPRFLHADSEDSDQTGRMPRLIWVFAGRTLILLFVGFVISPLKCVWYFIAAQRGLNKLIKYCQLSWFLKFLICLSSSSHQIQPRNHLNKTFFFFDLGFTARQDYFTHFEPSQSKGEGGVQKQEMLEKNHVTTRRQNLACLTWP